MSRILEIELSCCGDCPYFNHSKKECNQGAVDHEGSDEFFNDCPLEYKEE